jgi:Clp amino terminal domain, pathogenicity island component
MRARRVVGESVFAAQRRGLGSVDLNALIIALVLEDQDPESFELNEQHPSVKQARAMQPQPKGILFSRECAIPREPFFSSDITENVLKRLDPSAEKGSIEHRLTEGRGASKPDQLSVSAELYRAIERAEELRTGLQYEQIEPLHLLAAVLRENCEGSRLLIEAGVTEAKVLDVLRTTAHPGETA